MNFLKLYIIHLDFVDLKHTFVTCGHDTYAWFYDFDARYPRDLTVVKNVISQCDVIVRVT
jgi:hypothetical protein